MPSPYVGCENCQRESPVMIMRSSGMMYQSDTRTTWLIRDGILFSEMSSMKLKSLPMLLAP